MPSPLDRYVQSGHTSVQGWLTETAIELVSQLARSQREHDVRGPACEIGVHHGRLFILLHLLTDASERSVGFDLFDDRQGENVDRSGAGSKAVLLANLARHGCDQSRIVLQAANSLELTPEAILERAGGRPRLFSVDGGHTADITANDLRLAAAVLAPGGLLILDDAYNEAWPTVAEGMFRVFFEGQVPLVPVATGGNKTIFTTDAAWARIYRDGVVLPKGLHFVRRQELLGHEVLAIESYRRTWQRRLVHSRLVARLRGR
jgi:hypothetical protein